MMHCADPNRSISKPLRRVRRSAGRIWRNVTGALVAATIAAGCGGSEGATRVQEEYSDAMVEQDVMVPMRDGVSLATDIYFPAINGERAPGEFPALITRTAYGKGGINEGALARARRGYVVLHQDVRGRFGSGGEFYPYTQEGDDGYDAAEWIVDQPWSDGQVSPTGGSYTGGTAHSLALSNPSGLTAVYARMTASNYFEDAAYLGGAPQTLHNLGWAMGHVTDEFEDQPDHPSHQQAERVFANWLTWLQADPTTHVEALSVVPEFADFYRDWLENSTYNDYWKQPGFSLEEYYDEFPDVPVFYLGGWYDLFLRGSLHTYRGLSDSRDVYLMVGPWRHGGPTPRIPFPEAVDFGPDADRPGEEVEMRWFDRWMKGDEDAFPMDRPVRIFVMGGGGGHKTEEGRFFHGGSWRDEADWPLARMTPVAYHFHADGSLSPEAPTASEPSRYVYDPADPVPTIGGNMTHGRDVVHKGPADQRCRPEYPHCRDTLPLADREDVVVFETEPLQEPVEVTGPLTVRLWVSSSAVDTDFTAKLVEVYPPSDDWPDGFALNLADGVKRARFRDSMETENFMTPGEIYELEIDLIATSNVFSPGNRIRVMVSSSNFPRVDINPNTGEPTNFHTRTVPAENAIYNDPEHPSQIILPIIPTDQDD